MAMVVSEVVEWLHTLQPDDLVAIDDGGLAIVLVDGEAYCEVGGIPVDDED